MKTVSDKGFTFLEVMISISILALIFVSLFRMQSGTIGLAAACKFDSMAPLMAKQLLVKIDQDIAGWYKTEGDFGKNFPGVRWTCRISNVSVQEFNSLNQSNRNRLKKIELTITGSSRITPYELVTWRYSVE